MITTLTDRQQAQIAEYRDRYFARATSTEPSDRPRAEAAARRLAEIGGVTPQAVTWVSSPDGGKTSYNRAIASLGASISDSISDSIWDSLWASLSSSLGASIRDSIWDSLWASLSS